MKAFKSAYLLITMAMFMCEEPVEIIRCTLNCDPNNCLVVDEENCECVTDPDCEAEKLLGEDLEDCTCAEADGGSWCTALTGDSIKTWIFLYAYDSTKNEVITELGELMFIIGGEFFRYQRDHIYRRWWEGTGVTDIYSWEFDNNIQPTKILYKCIDRGPGYPCATNNFDYERDLIKLNSDTLILAWPYKNELNGWIAYVPYDE